MIWPSPSLEHLADALADLPSVPYRLVDAPPDADEPVPYRPTPQLFAVMPPTQTEPARLVPWEDA